MTFTPDRGAYIRSHVRLAAICMAGAMGVLWLLGDPNIWVGAVAGLAAISLRGWFLMSEELAAIWQISGDRLEGPAGRAVPLAEIALVRSLGSFVQVVTRSGDKHLIKYQSDPAATVVAIETAC